MRISASILLFMLAIHGWTEPLFEDPLIVHDRASSMILIEDIDSDGWADILLHPTLIALNNLNETTTFTLSPTQLTGGSAGFTLAEIDGHDGKDIAWIGSGVSVAYNQGLTTPTFSNTQEIWDRDYQRGIAAGDLTNDSVIDIVVSGHAGTPPFGEWVSIFENQGTSPTSFVRHDLVDPETGQTRVDIGDLNNDGKPDIITTGFALLVWRENTTTETMSFTKRIIATTPYFFHQPKAVDFDNDDDLDILVNSKAELIWFENLDPTNPDFEPHEIYIDLSGDPTQLYSSPNIADYDVLDFDQDGDWDLVVAGRRLVLLENTGDDVTFSPQIIMTPTDVELIVSVAAGDLDLDGYPDLAVAFSRIQPANGSIVVYMNQFATEPNGSEQWNQYQ